MVIRKMNEYTAVYRRDIEDGVWLVEVPEIEGCHTYGRTLSSARAYIREAISAATGEPEDSFEIVDEIELEGALGDQLEEVLALRAELEETQRKVVELTNSLAWQLRKMELSTRDTADLLGLSHQRIAQVLKAEN